MNFPKELCWNITSRCNARCSFCYRINNIADLSYQENEIILKKLADNGIKRITWTGGEAILYHDLLKLMHKAFDLGITNELITNGKNCSRAFMDQAAPLLSLMTISLDSCSSDINKKMGREINQLQIVEEIVTYMYAHYPDVVLKINTMAGRCNIDALIDVADFVVKHKIDRWRIFQFIDLRGDAIMNRENYWIEQEDYAALKKCLNTYLQSYKLPEYVDHEAIEDDYCIIRTDGEVVVTHKKRDLELGNLLYEPVGDIVKRIQEL